MADLKTNTFLEYVPIASTPGFMSQFAAATGTAPSHNGFLYGSLIFEQGPIGEVTQKYSYMPTNTVRELDESPSKTNQIKRSQVRKSHQKQSGKTNQSKRSQVSKSHQK